MNNVDLLMMLDATHLAMIESEATEQPRLRPYINHLHRFLADHDLADDANVVELMTAIDNYLDDDDAFHTLLDRLETLMADLLA